jgi:HlyD family secretion protein
MKKYILSSGLVGLILGASFVLIGAGWVTGPGQEKSQDKREPAINPGTISQPQPSGGLVCFGSVDVEGGTLSLYPAIPGKVIEIAVKEGDTVKAEAVLFKLEDELAQYQLQEAQAALQAAEAQLRKAKNAPQQHKLLIAQQKAGLLALEHDLASARLVASSKDKLVASKFLAPEEASAAWEQHKKLLAAEQAEKAKLEALELNDPSHDLERAEADVLAKKAQLSKAEYGLDQCRVKAPMDGTVVRLLIGKGEVLGPMPRQPAVIFCPDLPRIVRAEVEQEFTSMVQPGQEAILQDETRSNGPTVKGKVTRIAQMYTPRRTNLPINLPLQEVRVLEFIVQLDPQAAPLPIGQRVRVRLVKE